VLRARRSRGVSTARLAAATAALLVGAAAPGAAAPDGPLAAIETAPVVVVADVRRVEALAYAGYRATLDVERSLRETDRVPATMTVAWEEPAPSLPPRLAVGRRVLIAAGPLPTASIWRTRVPDDAARAAMLGLAGGGAGHLERPGAAELDVLEHYLLVGEAARAGDAGVLHLSRLCAVAQPRLALDAARRLDTLDALGEHFTRPATEAFVEALLRDDVPGLRQALLDLIERRRPEALDPVIRARLRAAGAAAPPVLHAALGALRGGLDDDEAVPLLRGDSVEARVAAARQATGPRAHALLRDLMRDDPVPSVRAAAVTRLVALDGAKALPDAMRALEDPAADVRLAAVQAAARLDPEAVEPLRRVALHGPPDAARAAVAALSSMGDEAHETLAELAAEHPDPSMRTLAGIAIGQPIGHRD